MDYYYRRHFDRLPWGDPCWGPRWGCGRRYGCYGDYPWWRRSYYFDDYYYY